MIFSSIIASVNSLPLFSIQNNAMVSIYGGPGAHTMDMLDALDNSGITALFLFDPYDEDFNEEIVKKVISRRHNAGILIPKVVADLKNVKKQVRNFKTKFEEQSGLTPKIVRMETKNIAEDVEDAIKMNNLILFKPSFTLSPRPDFDRFAEKIDGLDPSNGKVSFCFPEEATYNKISKIITHIRQKNFNILHPEVYLGKDLMVSRKIDKLNGNAKKSALSPYDDIKARKRIVMIHQ